MVRKLAFIWAFIYALLAGYLVWLIVSLFDSASKVQSFARMRLVFTIFFFVAALLCVYLTASFLKQACCGTQPKVLRRADIRDSIPPLGDISSRGVPIRRVDDDEGPSTSPLQARSPAMASAAPRERGVSSEESEEGGSEATVPSRAPGGSEQDPLGKAQATLEMTLAAFEDAPKEEEPPERTEFTYKFAPGEETLPEMMDSIYERARRTQKTLGPERSSHESALKEAAGLSDSTRFEAPKVSKERSSILPKDMYNRQEDIIEAQEEEESSEGSSILPKFLVGGTHWS